MAASNNDSLYYTIALESTGELCMRTKSEQFMKVKSLFMYTILRLWLPMSSLSLEVRSIRLHPGEIGA